MKTCKKGLHQYEGRRCLECRKDYKKTAKYREYVRAYSRTPKCKEDQKGYRAAPLAKLRNSIRALVYQSFKRRGYSKKSKTFNILQCTSKELSEYLEASAFRNYGSFIDLPGIYHVDHIVPLASATNEGDLIRLNHYTNLQLLYAEENRLLGAKDFRKKSRQAL